MLSDGKEKKLGGGRERHGFPGKVLALSLIKKTKTKKQLSFLERKALRCGEQKSW